jgi:uncharacterized membrane protein HdeD (DUF308 family)
MARVVDRAADRIAPWRGADWRVVIGEGVLLILGGVYFLADGERAEYILALLISAGLVADGCRQWFLGFRRLERGRVRDITLIRGAVGFVVGVLVIALSAVQQITVVGMRIALGCGGLAYGLLGLLTAIPSIRHRRAHWTSIGFDALLAALGVLLLYRVATSDSISQLLAVMGWLVIGSGAATVLVGILRRPTEEAQTPAEEGQGEGQE